MSKSDPNAPKRLALIASKGTLDWAYPPFILGSAAAAMGWEVCIFFTFYGLTLLKPKLTAAVTPVGKSITDIQGSATASHKGARRHAAARTMRRVMSAFACIRHYPFKRKQRNQRHGEHVAQGARALSKRGFRVGRQHLRRGDIWHWRVMEPLPVFEQAARGCGILGRPRA